jgi:Cache domain
MSNLYSNKKKNKRVFGIREQLLLSFIVLSIVTLGSLGIATGVFIGEIGDTTSTESTVALEAQLQSDMKNKTYNYASVIDNELQHVANDLNGIAESINDIFQDPFEYGSRKSYYHADILPAGTKLFDNTVLTKDQFIKANQPPDIRYDPVSEFNVSDSYSHYLIYKDTYKAMGNNEYNLSGEHGKFINRSAHLDPTFAGIKQKNPHYSWIYVDFSIGIQRTFPYTGADPDVFGTASEPGYDYKTGEWYINAKAAGGKIVWTEPYIDPYIGWMISVSRAVYNGTETAGNFLGCVGIDLTLTTITASVGNVKFLQTGYGFLIDPNGYVVSHPNVIFDPADEEYLEVGDIEPITATILSKMSAGDSGFNAVSKKGENYYLAYAPVTVSGYTLCIMVPQDEALASVRAIESEISKQMAVQIGIISAVVVIVTIVVLIIGIKVADSVVKPIQNLTKVALKLSTDNVKKSASEIDTDFDKELMEQDDEIGELTRAFQNLIFKVREDAQKEDN